MSKHQISSGASYAPTAEAEKVVKPGEFNFAAALLDHGHIILEPHIFGSSAKSVGK